jgi:hypothetical protein
MASGFKFPAHELVRQWDGALVHRSFVDKRRQPQDFPARVRDDQRHPNPSPESADTFIDPGSVTAADL